MFLRLRSRLAEVIVPGHAPRGCLGNTPMIALYLPLPFSSKRPRRDVGGASRSVRGPANGTFNRPGHRFCLGVVLLLFASLSVACGNRTRQGTDDWTLYRNLAQSQIVEIVTPSDDFSQQLEERWSSTAAPGQIATKFRSLGSRASKGAALILIGTQVDTAPAELALSLGVELVPGEGFRIFGRDFFDPKDAFRAVMENPRRPGIPMTLWFGNDLASMWPYLEDLTPRWRLRMEVYDQGDLAFSCPISRRGLPNMELGVDYLARREVAAKETGAIEAGGVRIWANNGISPARLQSYMQAMVSTRASTLRALGEPVTPRKPGPLVEVYISTDPEQFVEILGESALSKVNPLRQSVDTLLATGMPDDRGAAVGQATALAILGEPAFPWMLDGIGVAASGTWWDHPLDEVVGGLIASGTAPTLEQIVDPASDAVLSPHVLGPLRGQLMLFLLDDINPKGLRSLWRGVRQWKVDDRLRVLWREALQGTVRGTAVARKKRAVERANQTSANTFGGFHAGVALIDDHTAGDSNYLSALADDQLESLKLLGASTFSVHVKVPLFVGPLKEDGVRPGIASASASDLALLTVLARGKNRGLSPVLVIDLLSADSGPRADQAALVDSEDWEEFFWALLPVVQHYALLAELVGVDALCLGQELSIAMGTLAPAKATNEDPIAGELRAVRSLGWRAVARISRSLFHGVLTLSTRRPDHAARMGEWDLFDAVAIELWPAFQDRDGVSPSLESVTRSYSHLLHTYNKLAREVGKPILITQVGFPARARSWSGSWRPRGELDPEAQVIAYQALSAAIESALKDSMPLIGLHIWSWPVDGRAARGFAPASDEAREVLGELFAQSR
ncbi:MAG: hypothetical protein ACI8PQ_000469 [Planctomycetota bacterium]|jgi:hypothetical protein